MGPCDVRWIAWLCVSLLSHLLVSWSEARTGALLFVFGQASTKSWCLLQSEVHPWVEREALSNFSDGKQARMKAVRITAPLSIYRRKVSRSDGATFFFDEVHHDGKVLESDIDKDKKKKQQLRRSPEATWKPSRMEPKPLNTLWKKLKTEKHVKIHHGWSQCRQFLCHALENPLIHVRAA